VAAAEAAPRTRMALLDLPGFKRQQRRLELWWQAVRSSLDLPDSALPALRSQQDGPPAPRSWASKDPQAAARFGRARAHVLAVAEQHNLPAEVLISPDIIRRVAWSPPDPLAQDELAAAMADRGARPWQIALLAPGLAAALAER
jgi:ribonuclease D